MAGSRAKAEPRTMTDPTLMAGLKPKAGLKLMAGSRAKAEPRMMADPKLMAGLKQKAG